MPQIKLRLIGEEMEHAQLELLIKISADQKAITDCLKKIMEKKGMNTNKFNLHKSVVDPVILQSFNVDLLIETLAHLRAANSLIIEGLANNDYEANEWITLLNEQKHEYSIDIIEDLYERRGSIDLNEIQ